MSQAYGVPGGQQPLVEASVPFESVGLYKYKVPDFPPPQVNDLISPEEYRIYVTDPLNEILRNDRTTVLALTHKKRVRSSIQEKATSTSAFLSARGILVRVDIVNSCICGSSMTLKVLTNPSLHNAPLGVAPPSVPMQYAQSVPPQVYVQSVPPQVPPEVPPETTL